MPLDYIRPLYQCFQKHLSFLVSAATTTKSIFCLKDGWRVVCTVSVFGTTLKVYVCSFSEFFVLLLLFSCSHIFSIKDCGVYAICTHHYPEGLITEGFPNLLDSFLLVSNDCGILHFYRDCFKSVFTLKVSFFICALKSLLTFGRQTQNSPLCPRLGLL